MDLNLVLSDSKLMLLTTLLFNDTKKQPLGREEWKMGFERMG